jgi:hypothetical protein
MGREEDKAMPRRAEGDAPEQPSTGGGGVLRPHHRQETSAQPREEVTHGIGSRSPLVETGHEPAAAVGRRGLLPAPPEVEAEVARQEAGRPMTPEYRRTLSDRLTLAHYFAVVEVAFRRTPQGVEVLAAGLDEIAEFRRAGTREQREGVVYGVG